MGLFGGKKSSVEEEMLKLKKKEFKLERDMMKMKKREQMGKVLNGLGSSLGKLMPRGFRHPDETIKRKDIYFPRRKR